MNVGDLVRIIWNRDGSIGTIISLSGISPGWHAVYLNGDIVQWPESQMEVLE